MPTIKQILDEVYPITDLQLWSKTEFELWKYRRDKLRRMIEQHKAGEIINFEPLKISVDLEALLKKMLN